LSGKRSKQGFWESLKNGSKDSDAADKEADRLTELMMHGLTTEQAAAQLDKEEAGAPKMTFPAGGNRLTADQADAQLDKEEAGAPKMTFPAGGKRFGSYGPQQLPAGLLDAIPGLERSGDNATSPKGAQGRYQLMPATAAHYGVDANDPDAAKGAASKLLLELYTHFNGDVYKTLAGYNWGQTKLDQDIAAHGDAWRDYLPKETADYIGRYQGDTHSVQIGDIHVHTTATNGKQIAQDIRTDIRNRGLVTQSTSAIN
jgi:hypothetical protein